MSGKVSFWFLISVLGNLRLNQLKCSDYNQLYQTCAVFPSTIFYAISIEKRMGSTKKLPENGNNKKDIQVVEDKDMISINLV